MFPNSALLELAVGSFSVAGCACYFYPIDYKCTGPPNYHASNRSWADASEWWGVEKANGAFGTPNIDYVIGSKDPGVRSMRCVDWYPELH
ncbi:hypothetical protein TWF694_003725 [Orbilia ellipsospora]|uniref:Uncharacterized protein n=1 Tax=Orbilia ellipsospora TaxID=2528407 RepID=A0AAV9X1J9_9PEZI